MLYDVRRGQNANTRNSSTTTLASRCRCSNSVCAGQSDTCTSQILHSPLAAFPRNGLPAANDNTPAHAATEAVEQSKQASTYQSNRSRVCVRSFANGVSSLSRLWWQERLCAPQHTAQPQRDKSSTPAPLKHSWPLLYFYRT